MSVSSSGVVVDSGATSPFSIRRIRSQCMHRHLSVSMWVNMGCGTKHLGQKVNVGVCLVFADVFALLDITFACAIAVCVFKLFGCFGVRGTCRGGVIPSKCYPLYATLLDYLSLVGGELIRLYAYSPPSLAVWASPHYATLRGCLRFLYDVS